MPVTPHNVVKGTDPFKTTLANIVVKHYFNLADSYGLNKYKQTVGMISTLFIFFYMCTFSTRVKISCNSIQFNSKASRPDGRAFFALHRREVVYNFFHCIIFTIKMVLGYDYGFSYSVALLDGK